MIKIDDALLERLGLGNLPADAKEGHKQALYKALELEVGMRLASRMTDEQLDDFERLMEGPERFALAWLHINFPAYKQVVHEEFERLTEELARQAADILSLELGYARS